MLLLFSWLKGLDGSPGLSTQSIELLRTKRTGSDGWKYDICGITIDAMSIMKRVKWDHLKQEPVGYVDLGCGKLSDDLATEALVIMALGIKSAWKLPVAYFLTNKITAVLQKSMLKLVFDTLISVDVIPVSLTLDGTTTNFSTIKNFGCNIDPKNLKPWFDFPSSPLKKIFVFPDPCHMLKLLRNIFGNVKQLKICGEMINWKYIEQLHEVQKKEGLRAANKLSDRHINWQKQKMKVYAL